MSLIIFRHILKKLLYLYKKIGLNGIEPLTLRLSGVYSKPLSYKPLF
jgi:hypothetical protein